MRPRVQRRAKGSPPRPPPHERAASLILNHF
jgi:hypothetical protein